MYICLHVKFPLFLSDFNENWSVSTDFQKNAQISNFMKIRPVGAKLDRRIDRPDEAKSRFSQFCEKRPKKNTQLNIPSGLGFDAVFGCNIPDISKKNSCLHLKRSSSRETTWRRQVMSASGRVQEYMDVDLKPSKHLEAFTQQPRRPERSVEMSKLKSRVTVYQ